MEKYKITKTLGDGAFGTVFKAVNINTNEVVAIKKMKRKFESWDECKQLREIKSLMKLTHPYIIKLNEVLRVNDELHLVFEFLDENLYQCYQKLKETKETRLSEKQIKSVIYRATEALAFMHKHGFFHRDMKPENILVHRDAVKLADFGLAREIRSRPPFTDYVSTRWYRAPEILLKATNYNSPIDIFALGCIMAELYLMTPLFAGTSEFDQIYKICSVLGTPSSTTWPEGYRLASQIGFSFPQMQGIGLGQVIKDASLDAIELITDMLKFDPAKRPTAAQVLQHPYFAGFSPSNILINDSEPLPRASLGTFNDNKPNQMASKLDKEEDPIAPLSKSDSDSMDQVLNSLLGTTDDTKQGGGLGVELRLPGGSMSTQTKSTLSDPFNDFGLKSDTKKYDFGAGNSNQDNLTNRNRRGQSVVQDYSTLGGNNEGNTFDYKYSYNDGTQASGLGSHRNSAFNNYSTKDLLSSNFPGDNSKTKTNDLYDFSHVLVKKDKQIGDGGLEEKPYQPTVFGSNTNTISSTNVQGGYKPSFMPSYKDESQNMNGDFGGNYNNSKPFISGATNRTALGGNKFGSNKDMNYGGNTTGTYTTGYQAKPYGQTLQSNASNRNFSGISATGGMDGMSYNNGSYDIYKF